MTKTAQYGPVFSQQRPRLEWGGVTVGIFGMGRRAPATRR